MAVEALHPRAAAVGVSPRTVSVGAAAGWRSSGDAPERSMAGSGPAVGAWARGAPGALPRPGISTRTASPRSGATESARRGVPHEGDRRIRRRFPPNPPDKSSVERRWNGSAAKPGPEAPAAPQAPSGGKSLLRDPGSKVAIPRDRVGRVAHLPRPPPRLRGRDRLPPPHRPARTGPGLLAVLRRADDQD